MRASGAAFALLLTLSLSACSTASRSLSYYAHVLQGGLGVLQARQPIERVLEDPARDAALKDRLKGALAARRFAVTALGLPDNASYTSYSELDRPFVVWNVFASPELSLKPVTHCFPVAGCVAYQGYYALERAQAEAERLQRQGAEAFVGGVSAYSTLGWFDDPLLSSMLRWDDERLAATIFHELSHQVVYVKGDTAFNESYSKFVELEGLRQWRVARGLPEALPPDLLFEGVFIERMLAARTALTALYESPQTDAAKRAEKQRLFDVLEADITRLATEAGASDAYRRFFATPMNNAKLLPFGLYHQWRPAFAELYRQQGARWTAFYAAVQALAKLDATERKTRLEALQSQADALPP